MDGNKEEEKQDRISSLPDGLLIDILSRLPSTKHAIRTSSLSKSWKYLWTYVPNLIIQSSDHKLQHWRSEFFPSIDKTLAQCPKLKLQKFHLESTYYTQFDSQISNWVRFALSCNVEELNLKLVSLDFKSKFDLDRSIFINSWLTDLNLVDCKLNPIGAISWKNLKTLSITRAKLDEDLIENILSGSPALEALTLEYCYGYNRLDITSKSVKNLVLSGYGDLKDDDSPAVMEVNAPYILSLTIQDKLYVWKVSLLNVSCLVKAHLDFNKCKYRELADVEDEETLRGFLLKLRHVKELKIGKSCSQAMSLLDLNGFNFPSNVNFFGCHSITYRYWN